ncbi:hypothetical protein F2Q68_00019747 [Brassica cretica]|nr:hypothetical protein F2Q68_00019747 [Brassica cretica]
MCLVYQVNLTKESDDDSVSSLEDQEKNCSEISFEWHHEKRRTEFLWFEKGQHKKVK